MTVEIKSEHRAALLALATRRGHKGYSSLLEEAIESYLVRECERERRRLELVPLAGSLSKEMAVGLRETTQELRDSWR